MTGMSVTGTGVFSLWQTFYCPVLRPPPLQNAETKVEKVFTLNLFYGNIDKAGKCVPDQYYI